MNTDKAKEFVKNWMRKNPNTIHIASEHEVQLMTYFAQQQAQEKAMAWDIWKAKNGWQWHPVIGCYQKIVKNELNLNTSYVQKTFTELWQLFEKES